MTDLHAMGAAAEKTEEAPWKGKGTGKDFREALAQEIAAENSLITNRMTWNLTFQGFLFTGYALAVDKKGAETFLCVLPRAGIAVAVLAVAGVIAALWQIWVLQRCWSDDLQPWGPKPFSSIGRALSGAAAPILIPVVLIVAWLQFLR